MLSTPFRNISERIAKNLTFSIAFLLFIESIVTFYLNKRIKNSIAPNGIISFEFANTLEHSQDITASWTPFAKIFAGIEFGFELLYLLIYLPFIANITHKINTHLWSKHLFYNPGELLICNLLGNGNFRDSKKCLLDSDIDKKHKTTLGSCWVLFCCNQSLTHTTFFSIHCNKCHSAPH